MAKKIEKYLPVDYSDSFSIEVTENRLSPKDIILKERLRPGKMLLVDTVKGELIEDDKGLFSQTFRYRN